MTATRTALFRRPLTAHGIVAVVAVVGAFGTLTTALNWLIGSEASAASLGSAVMLTVVMLSPHSRSAMFRAGEGNEHSR